MREVKAFKIPEHTTDLNDVFSVAQIAFAIASVRCALAGQTLAQYVEDETDSESQTTKSKFLESQYRSLVQRVRRMQSFTMLPKDSGLDEEM